MASVVFHRFICYCDRYVYTVSQCVVRLCFSCTMRGGAGCWSISGCQWWFTPCWCSFWSTPSSLSPPLTCGPTWQAWAERSMLLRRLLIFAWAVSQVLWCDSWAPLLCRLGRSRSGEVLGSCSVHADLHSHLVPAGLHPASALFPRALPRAHRHQICGWQTEEHYLQVQWLLKAQNESVLRSLWALHVWPLQSFSKLVVCTVGFFKSSHKLDWDLDSEMNCCFKGIPVKLVISEKHILPPVFLTPLGFPTGFPWRK